MRVHEKYHELEFYMERIAEIQEELSLANHWFFIMNNPTVNKDNPTENDQENGPENECSL